MRLCAVRVVVVRALLLQEVNAVHELFMERVRHVFDLHKEAYGWGHKTLVIR